MRACAPAGLKRLRPRRRKKSPKRKSNSTPKGRRGRSIAKVERRRRGGADMHRDGSQERPRGDAALCARARWSGRSGYKAETARTRGVDGAKLWDGEPGGGETGVFARLSRQGGGAGRVGGDGRVAP